MAESRASTSSPPQGEVHGPQPVNSDTPAIGTIVLVRTSINSVAPAIVTNDFSGGNAPGVVSLVVFNAADFNNVIVKAVPSAQAETFETDPEDLSRELTLHWMPMGSSLAKRNLEKEIADKRQEARDQVENPPPTKGAT